MIVFRVDEPARDRQRERDPLPRFEVPDGLLEVGVDVTEREVEYLVEEPLCPSMITREGREEDHPRAPPLVRAESLEAGDDGCSGPSGYGAPRFVLVLRDGGEDEIDVGEASVDHGGVGEVPDEGRDVGCGGEGGVFRGEARGGTGVDVEVVGGGEEVLDQLGSGLPCGS